MDVLERSDGRIHPHAIGMLLPTQFLRAQRLAGTLCNSSQPGVGARFLFGSTRRAGLTGIWESILDGYMKFLNLLKISLAFFR